MNSKRDWFYYAYIILATLILLRLLPFYIPDGRLWGFNHLIFLPDIYSILYLCIAAILLSLPFFKFTEDAGEKLSGMFNELFFESKRKYFYRAIFITFISGFFILFLAPTHFLGDGYTWLKNLAGGRKTIFKWSEGGATLLLAGIQSILGEKNEMTARLSYQIVSVLSGLGSIWFFFGIAGQLSERKIKRTLVFFCLLCSGSLLMFFGYVEHYPILWFFFAGYVYFSLKYIIEGKGLLFSLVFLLLGIFFHIQIAIYIPAFVYLVFCRDKGYDYYGRFRIAIWTIIALIALLGIAILYNKYTTNLYVENIFLPPLTGKPIDPAYYLFSPSHLADIINQFLLLSPLIILLLAFSIKNIRSVFVRKRNTFLVIITISASGFIFIIDPKLAMARDWDLFSLSAFGITILTISLINIRQIHVLAKLLLPMIIFLTVVPLPFLLTNLNHDRSIEYYNYIIKLDHRRSLSSIVTLRNYFRETGETARKDSVDRLYNLYHANDRKMSQAFNALENEKVELAAVLIKSIQPDRFNPNYHNLYAILNFHMGNYYTALKASDRAIQLRGYDAKLLSNRAQIYFGLKQYDKAMEELMKGYQLDSADISIIEGLSFVYCKLEKYGEASFYARKLLEPPIESKSGYYFLCKIMLYLGKLDEADEFYRQYTEYGQEDPFYTGRSSDLRKYFSEIEKE